MTVELRQSTAVDILIGPFVDEDDGKTLEESLTISQGDVMLSKNGQPLAQKNDATACAFDDLGCYNCELDATDTNTLGELTVIVFEDGALPFRRDYAVITQQFWDSKYGADVLQVDVAQWLGTAAATPTVAGVPEVDLTHVAGATTNVAALATGMATLLADWLNGGRLDLILDIIAQDTTTDIPAVLTTISGFIDTEIASLLTLLDTEIGAILTDTNELQTDWVNGGRLDLLIDAIKAVTDLLTAAHAEPAGVPAANATPLAKLAFLFKWARNRMDDDGTKRAYYDDSGVIDAEKDLSDNGTTYSESEMNAP